MDAILNCTLPILKREKVFCSSVLNQSCTSVLDFHSKNLGITRKLLTRGYIYHMLRKTFGKFFRSYSELLSKFCDISFQEYVSKGISHPVFYGDLVYKYTEDDNINMLEFLVDNIFVVFGGGRTCFPTDSRHSNGHKLCPSLSRHISVFIRNGIHTVFALNWKEKKSISVQLHIQIHR